MNGVRTGPVLNNFLYDDAANLEIEMKFMLEYMLEKNEQQGTGEPSRVDEAGTDNPASASIDTNIFCRSTPPKILERSSCLQDIADSTQKSTNIPSCHPALDVDREIARKDLLELEDREQLVDLDSSREVIPFKLS